MISTSLDVHCDSPQIATRHVELRAALQHVFFIQPGNLSSAKIAHMPSNC
jgi:hypothetical protein